jgi:tetratricopeptide (TPR) repeat protein
MAEQRIANIAPGAPTRVTTWLDPVVTEYANALKMLCSLTSESTASSDVPLDCARLHEVLLARDNVARALRARRPLPPKPVEELVNHDRLLKARLTQISLDVPEETFRDWREAVQPPADAWWWHLDERAAAAHPRPVPILALIAILFLIVAGSLMADTAAILAGARWNAAEVLAAAAPLTFTLLGLGTFTEIGRTWIERIRFNTGFKIESINAWRALFAFVLMALAFGLNWILPPFVSSAYNNRGHYLQQGGLGQRAIEHYQRAIAVDPQNIEAHFNLGTAFEDILEFDKAIEEYRRVIALDRGYYRAHNNLGRLYILKKEFATALNELQRALDQDPPEDAARYSIHKNMGWANFNLQAYERAEEALNTAINLIPENGDADYGASAHCLMMEVLRVRQDADRVRLRIACADCIRYAAAQSGRTEEVEAVWLQTAQQILAEEDKK